MEWQQLEYFQVVAKLEHMTKAAEELSISQSALSRSISKLEEILGVPLFDRQGRSIQLNRYGKLFLHRVNNMMNEFDEAVHEIQDLNDPEKGAVSLGFLHTLGTSIVPDLIRAYRQQHPNVNFTLTQNYTHSQLTQLKNSELDLCLLAYTEIDAPIQWTKLWSDELFLIVPLDHPLAEHDTVRLADVGRETFILMKKGFALRNTAERLFRKVGIDPTIKFEGDEVGTVAGFVGAGLGISLLPDGEEINETKMAKLRVTDIVCERTIGLAWIENRYHPPAVKEFYQFILNYFRNKGPQV